MVIQENRESPSPAPSSNIRKQYYFHHRAKLAGYQIFCDPNLYHNLQYFHPYPDGIDRATKYLDVQKR
jgi:hypothetical protein